MPGPAPDVDVLDLVLREGDFVRRTGSTLTGTSPAELVALPEVVSQLSGEGIVVFLDKGNSGAAMTVTANLADLQRIVLTANLTLTLEAIGARRVELLLVQDATGGRTVTWPASVKWPGGVPPTLSTTPGAVDRILLTTYDAGATWYGDVIGFDYA